MRFFPPEISGKISLEFIKFFPFLLPKKKINLKESNSFFKKPIIYGNLKFENYLGIGAGLDKEGKYFASLGSLGFGFVEVGTFTPVAQPGNDRPRIKRINKEKSLINRLGFNNPGILQAVRNIRSNKGSFKGILGVSIGKNKNTKLEEAHKDYVFCLEKCFEISDYIAINISSPNTEDLRRLSSDEYLENLLVEINHCYESLEKKHQKKVPLLLKLSPDELDKNLEKIIQVSSEKKISGFILSNTTEGTYEGFNGGISGPLLKDKSLSLLKKVNSLINGDSLLIASGGVTTKQDLEERLDNGAKLIQIYTSFIYQGPKILDDLLN